MGTRHKVISIFAGCGGSSLGYRLAGFEEILAIDFDRNSTDTFKLNFPEVPCWQKDIKEVTGREILEFCNIKRYELDILDGSPPCQGFSTAGNRIIMDERNNLFVEFVRLINELQPRVFVMENVSGMVKGKMKGKFLEILRKLKSTKYRIKCKLLNSKHYGVPQSRQRLFFIGIREDLNREPIFPKPTGKIISVGNALKSMGDIGEIKKPTQNRMSYVKKLKTSEKISKYTPNGSGFTTVRISSGKPSPTITKTINLIHFSEDRYLTIAELKRLAFFPDNFKFVGSFGQQWARIGNAVMPMQICHIAKKISEEIL